MLALALTGVACRSSQMSTAGAAGETSATGATGSATGARGASGGETGSTGSPAIIQPGAPGQENRTISAAASTDLSNVRFTPADAKFMQGMIGHHQQALEMVALIPERTSRDESSGFG